MTNKLRALLSPFRYTVAKDGSITILRLLDKLSTLSLYVPEGVTAIAANAFSDAVIERIYLPATLKTIGASAFSGCSALRRVHLGSLDAYLDIQFENREACPGIYAREFLVDGQKITSYTLPIGKRVIGPYAFSGMRSLQKVTLPEGFENVGEYAFAECGLEDITFPSSLKAIGDYAFWGNAALKHITLPDSLKTLPRAVFGACTALRSITLPNALQTVGELAFAYTALDRITLPKSCRTIGEGAFRDCRVLKSAVLPEGLETIGDYAFYRATALSDISFPDSLLTLGNHAFARCEALTSIILPKSLLKIGQSAFAGCSALAELHFPLKRLSLGQNTIEGCPSLREITLPNYLYICGQTLPLTPYREDMGKSTLLPEEIKTLAALPLTKQASLFCLADIKEQKLDGHAMKKGQMMRSLAEFGCELIVKDGVIVGVICYDLPLFPEKSQSYDITEPSGVVIREKLTLHCLLRHTEGV